MKADFSLDYDVLTMERDHQIYLMARFLAGSTSTDKKRRPLNLSLIIDRSGSMAGAKIDYTRQAAQFLVQNLGTQDLFSVVLYNDKVETLIEPSYVINKDSINQKIEKIRISGTTNLSGGWLQGCTHVGENFAKDRLNRVILMSDGLANRGVTDMNQLVNMVQQKYDGQGISTTTMGLGTDFNEDLMMAMAHSGGGAFYFIESPEVAPTIFNEELRGLLSVVGQNLTITITTSNHVSGVEQLNAYPSFQEKQVIAYRLGDIYAEEEKTLVLQLSIPALKKLGAQQIATLKFEYDELQDNSGSEHHVWEMPVNVNVSSGATSLPRDPKILQSVLLLKAANARKEAIREADNGQYENATGVLRKAIDEIDNSGINNEQLEEERAALEKQAEQLEHGSAGYDDYSRKTMATQAIYTLTSRHDETMVLRQRELLRELDEKPPLPPDIFNAQTNDYDPLVPPRESAKTPTQCTWKSTTFELSDRSLIRIGRSSHNEISITERSVSRFHAHLKRYGDKLVIEDLGSTNGTQVNNQPVFGSHTLSVGDIVLIGEEKLIFHDGNGTV